MIASFIVAVIHSREFLSALATLIVGTYLWYYFGLKKFSQREVMRFWLASVSIMILNLILASVLVFIIYYFAKTQASAFLTLFLLFNLFYSANLLVGFFLMKKNPVVKGKKFGDVQDSEKEEFNENKFRTLNLFLILSLVIFPMLFLGNRSINLLLIFLFISGAVSTFSEIYILPQAIKIFEKVLK